MNTKFVLRGLLFALPTAVIASVVGLVLIGARAMVGPPPDPTPPPPTILALRGELPAGPVGLQEWARQRGEEYSLRGCGFLLLLSDGEIVGVTTAHSLPIGDSDHPLEQVALRVAGQAAFVAEFDTLRGRPGQPRTGEDMRVDYVLLQAGQPIAPGFVLRPDQRGAPQPGERVSLFSGLGGVFEGTVQSVSEAAVWVLMDDFFDPGLMSGSPFVSQHTGQAVGMLIAGNLRDRRWLLAAHPIGSIVRLAESATESPKLGEYRR